MAKTPTAKEFLTDPKYGEQKGFLKEIMTGIAEEVREEVKKGGKKKAKDEDDNVNIFDSLFGGGED